MAAVVALLTSTGVMLGMGSLVIDVGRLAMERTELQSGADAASWAIALNCVRDKNQCLMAGQTTVALKYARANVKDGTADAQICIQGSVCNPWSSAAPCPSPVPGGTSVEVHTSTVNGSSTLLPPAFAGALSGASYTGTRVGACGRVAWGPPIRGKVLAVGISECDWLRMTGSGNTYFGPISSALGQLGLYPALGMNAPTATADGQIESVGLSLTNRPVPNCPGQPTVPRGWAFLLSPAGAKPDSNCELDLQVNDLPKSPLQVPLVNTLLTTLFGSACSTRLDQIIASGRPVLVPIYNKVITPNIDPQYQISGFASFVMTGHAALLPGVIGSVTSLLQSGPTAAVFQLACTLIDCISGYFTKTVVPVDQPVFGTGQDYGATVIGRTG